MRALISVSDKTGIVEFAEKLQKLGVEIISTGGSYQRLKDSGILVTNVSDITNFKECLDGRVKTLHPNVHAGILAMRSNKEHMKTLEELDIKPIDILVINLYPFKETISKEDVSLEDAIENIDIGGPTMLRAGAKNYQDVAVITDPSDYDKIIFELTENKEISLDTKTELSIKVFEETAYYDTLIANFLREKNGKSYPEKLTIAYDKAQDMRYGENPHQSACFYKEPLSEKGKLSNAVQLWGKELSYNNINDTNGALNLLKEFKDTPAVIAVKHSSPCGVSIDIDVYGAYKKAYECDPVSIFGGIIATNQTIDKKTAEKMAETFLEVIIAPDFSEEALEIFKTKKNLRLLKLEDIEHKSTKEITYKKVSGGMLVQDADTAEITDKFEIVTDRIPSKAEVEDMVFAMKVCKHTTSNGIVFAKDNATVSIGGGQVSRVWSVENCVNHSNDKSLGAVMASDAFFPFRDAVYIAIKAGIKAIIQPGGSVRDQDIIDLCNEHGIAMVFTKTRHFKH